LFILFANYFSIPFVFSCVQKIKTLLLAILPALVHAQLPGFDYTFEQAAQIENEVLIRWTLISGSTCNGTDIERSTDSINYAVIGRIEGICGSENINVQYDFKDASPVPNTRNFYRLHFNRVGYSEPEEIFVIILDAEGILIIPNPVIDKSVIHFQNNQNKSFVFTLYDYNGKQVRQLPNLTDDKYEFDRTGLPSGIYFFQLTYEGDGRVSGRIVVL